MTKSSYSVNNLIAQKAILSKRYSLNCEAYKKILQGMLLHTEEIIKISKINAVAKGRVKSFENIFKKLLTRSRDVDPDDPFACITDIIGIRIVVPFIEDIANVETLISSNFRVTEIDHKSKELNIREFGYDSTHLLAAIPESIASDVSFEDTIIAEIQLRTILQDAWAEVEHVLIYKTSIDKVEDSIRRKMVALNATLSLADITFQEIRDYQRKKYSDLQQRHRRLLDKVSTIPEKWGKSETLTSVNNPDSRTGNNKPVSENLNDIFVEALNAHLENRLDAAVDLYTKLIIMSPNHFIYNHRGLVYFTLSEYQRAVDDFTSAIEIEPNDTRVYTNRGLAFRMLKSYDLALADFAKSLELNPLWPDTFYGRALTYFDIGDVRSAIEDCDRAISLKPDFKQAARFKQYILNQEMN